MRKKKNRSEATNQPTQKQRQQVFDAVATRRIIRYSAFSLWAGQSLSLSLSLTHSLTHAFFPSFLSSERVSSVVFKKMESREREREKRKRKTRTFFRRTRDAFAQRERERDASVTSLSFFWPMRATMRKRDARTCVARVFCAFFFWFLLNKMRILSI